MVAQDLGKQRFSARRMVGAAFGITIGIVIATLLGLGAPDANANANGSETICGINDGQLADEAGLTASGPAAGTAAQLRADCIDVCGAVTPVGVSLTNGDLSTAELNGQKQGGPTCIPACPLDYSVVTAELQGADGVSSANARAQGAPCIEICASSLGPTVALLPDTGTCIARCDSHYDLALVCLPDTPVVVCSTSVTLGATSLTADGTESAQLTDGGNDGCPRPICGIGDMYGNEILYGGDGTGVSSDRLSSDLGADCVPVCGAADGVVFDLLSNEDPSSAELRPASGPQCLPPCSVTTIGIADLSANAAPADGKVGGGGPGCIPICSSSSDSVAAFTDLGGSGCIPVCGDISATSSVCLPPVDCTSLTPQTAALNGGGHGGKGSPCATITIEKNTVGGDGTFEFAAIASPNFEAVAEFELTTNSTTSNPSMPFTVDPGTYTLSELPTAGWELGDVSCEGVVAINDPVFNGVVIDVVAGDDITCTFTNEKLPTVTINKVAMPDDGTTFNFSGTVAHTATGTSSSGPIVIAAGRPLDVIETVPDGWVQQSVACVDEFDNPFMLGSKVANGEDITCTFTNAKLAKITVAKQALPATDTTAFEFASTGGDIFTASLANGATADFMVEPGLEYVFSETLPEGWKLTDLVCTDGGAADLAAGSATFTPEPDDDITCTFTNTKVEGCATGSINPCVSVTDPYVCGQGFTGTVADGTAPYDLVYALTATDGTTTTLPGFALAAAGDYDTPEGYIDHDVFSGQYSVDVTVTDAVGGTDQITIEATVTNDCTDPTPVTPTQSVSFVPAPDPQTEALLEVIRNLDSPKADESIANTTAAAAPATANAVATSGRDLAVTGASSSILTMLGLAILGSGAYVHGARRLRTNQQDD